MVAFVYGMTKDIDIPTGEVHYFNGDNQTGVAGGEGYVLVPGDGVSIDEDGNACARNMGIYTVTAKVTDGYSWVLDDEAAADAQDADDDEPEFVEVDGDQFEQKTREDQTIKFAIVAAPMDDVEIDDIADQGFTGAEVTPNPVVSIDGNVLEKDVDYTLQYSDNKNAGTATVKVIGRNNVSGEATACRYPCVLFHSPRVKSGT